MKGAEELPITLLKFRFSMAMMTTWSKLDPVVALVLGDETDNPRSAKSWNARTVLRIMIEHRKSVRRLLL